MKAGQAFLNREGLSRFFLGVNMRRKTPWFFFRGTRVPFLSTYVGVCSCYLRRGVSMNQELFFMMGIWLLLS